MKRNKRTMPSAKIRQTFQPAGFIILVLMALLALNGCGGGSGGDLMAGGGIGGTGIMVGQIAGFGSVIVNDVDFDTRKAQVMVNGQSLGIGDTVVQKELALGMIVRVEGTYHADGTGRADRIVFTSNVKGPVQSITPVDSVAKMLVVMGQAVIIDDQTRFNDTDFDNIAVSNVLEVSGWSGASGEVRATYVRKVSEALIPGTEIMIKGIVSETNLAQRWFRIDQLMVDISEIADPDPQVGQLVIVKGTLDDNRILIASALSIEDELGLDDAESVEIEGIVSQVSSPAEFILGTTAVRIDAVTLFKGLEPDDIVPGARLLVKGSLANRRLLADEIIAQDKVRIEGQISEIIGNQIVLKGLAGLVINVSDLTKIFGDAGELNELQIGQHIKVLGYAAGDDEVEAAQVKVEKKASAKVKLQGPVTEVSNFSVTVFRVDIDVSRINEFEIDSKGAVSRDEFISIATAGDTVSATGNLIVDAVEWMGIELYQE